MPHSHSRRTRRRLRLERLEDRALLAGDTLASWSQEMDAEGEAGNPWHNALLATDVNADGRTTPSDVLHVVRALAQGRTLGAGEGEPGSVTLFLDVNNDTRLTPSDAILVLRELVPEGAPPGACLTDPADDPKLLTKEDVCALLRRAAAASSSEDAIIAVVDRGGKILGVRLEASALATFGGDPAKLSFAIDGAVAKARTAAFFSSAGAPLTSRTIRFISQSTITEREVASTPNVLDPLSPLRGPGFVAPIGPGGHFPPDVANTPPVDLFGIEHQSRDSMLHPGFDGVKGTADDVAVTTRFDIDPAFLAALPGGMPGEKISLEFPESYGWQSGTFPLAQSRGIATLPGGVPLYKYGPDGAPHLIGGIGVFFPGPDGYASFEQGFVADVGQTTAARLNADRVLEAEWIAFAAAGGTDVVLSGEGPVTGITLAPFANARIDLVGITLEVFGPHPTREHLMTGVERLKAVGAAKGPGSPTSGSNVDVLAGVEFLSGASVPEGWLVEPHASAVDPLLTAADVKRIIDQGIAEAERVRAAIRLTFPDLRPGARTSMVLAVADTSGEVLGLFRMPDATIFSIDVAVAKARNTAYYAKGAVAADLIDDVDANRDGVPDGVGLSGDGVPDDVDGDGVPDSFAKAFTNRTFRFLALPRFASGTPAGTFPGAFSSLLAAGIHPLTAENLGPPLPAATYASPTTPVLIFDAFQVSRNFRDPSTPLKRQNGVVFFPGSSALYVGGTLVGGFGVSGDGVDQDDVVTAAGFAGYDAPFDLRADLIHVRGVRLPYIKYLRNPLG